MSRFGGGRARAASARTFYGQVVRRMNFHVSVGEDPYSRQSTPGTLEAGRASTYDDFPKGQTSLCVWTNLSRALSSLLLVYRYIILVEVHRYITSTRLRSRHPEKSAARMGIIDSKSGILRISVPPLGIIGMNHYNVLYT